MGGGSSEPWRALPEDYNKRLDAVKSYKPENKATKYVRILLYGPVGAGKSSFIDSVDSVLQDRITTRALTDTCAQTSFTKKYTTYKFRKGPGSGYSFVFNDIIGLEPDNGVHLEDFKLALKGHVRDGYKFLRHQQLKEGDPSYNSSPTLEDRVHVLVSVVPAGSVELMDDRVVEKMRRIRLAASEMGIPYLAILTKVDEACPEVHGDIKNTYKSQYLKGQVEKFSMLLGIPPNCIFLVQNYRREVNTNDDINALILFALSQMISFGEDFLSDLNLENQANAGVP